MIARVIIDTLPDIALLGIFEFYRYNKAWDAWQWWRTLVHVCRQWRIIIFGSPCRLGLRLECKPSTPVKKTLDVWPPLPIVIRVTRNNERLDNVAAALEHNDRISELDLWGSISSSQWEGLLEVMQKPFPALKSLCVRRVIGDPVPVIPASFLGRSAPCLKKLDLFDLPFPEFPNLLLSATHLTRLVLWGIPDSGYFSPEAFADGLSMAARLETILISFESPRGRSSPQDQCLPPRTRTLLPALTEMSFRGADKYLEALVARIDAPLLKRIVASFFHRQTLDTSQLTHFISRVPKQKEYRKASVYFSCTDVSVDLDGAGHLDLEILCTSESPDKQLSSLAQVCSSSISQVLVSSVKCLYIRPYGSSRHSWIDDNVERGRWLDLFRPFSAVERFIISREYVPCVARALEELGDEVTEVLPALRVLKLEQPLPSEPVLEMIEQFVAARELAGHPISIFFWEMNC